MSKKYHWKFTGNLSEIQALCKDFAAADALYWEFVEYGGFAIHEGALRFFSVCAEPEARNVIEWNRPETWKFEYKELLPEKLWCFAEDVFGHQFCFGENGVYWLDPETGGLEYQGETFSEWRKFIAPSIDYFTGESLAKAWHEAHDSDDPLTPDKVLMPLTLFMAGGKFEITNVFPLDAIEAMRVRGNIAYQIKDVPDGASIQIKFTE